MGMAGERQRDAWRHLRENIRLVHQQDHRIVGGDARERAGQIVDAAEAAGAEPIRELVAEPGEPEAAAAIVPSSTASFSMTGMCDVGQARCARP